MQGPNLGKHGVDVIPSSQRFIPTPPDHLKTDDSPESLTATPNPNRDKDGSTNEIGASHAQRGKLLPRETGHDIGMGSPVPLSAEAVQVITRLRNMKVRLTLFMSLFLLFSPSLYSDADASFTTGRGRGLESMARCRVSSQGLTDTKKRWTSSTSPIQ